MIRSSSKSVVIFASYDFVNRDLRAVFTPLDMLTYLFCLLSKPNSPFKVVTFLLIFISLLPTFLNQRFDSATKIHHFKEMLHSQVFLSYDVPKQVLQHPIYKIHSSKPVIHNSFFC